MAAAPDYTLPLDRLPDPLPVTPLSRPFDATVTPPGSKSLTNRAYVLAALAQGESTIRRPLRADDCDRLLAALATLGATSAWTGDDVVVTGVNGRFPRGGRVDLGHGGAPARFMIAAACLATAPVVVDGSPRMRERPVAEGVEMLRALGATLEYTETPERLPVRATAEAVPTGGVITVPTTLSSQFISALMLIAPSLRDGLELILEGPVTSRSYIELTEQVLERWGVDVRWEHRVECVVDERGGTTTTESPPVIRVAPGPVTGRPFDIEPDASSAACWLVATAACPGARLDLPGMRWPSKQPDLQIVASLDDVGVAVEGREGGFGVTGPPHLRWGLDVEASDMPDAAVVLAALATRCEKPSTIRGLRTLRVKESDRIAALATEIGKLGCVVETTDDSITVDPTPQHDRPVTIDTYDDHRMAMAFAVVGLTRPGLSIRDPACVAKSYPSFWRDLGRIAE